MVVAAAAAIILVPGSLHNILGEMKGAVSERVSELSEASFQVVWIEQYLI